MENSKDLGKKKIPDSNLEKVVGGVQTGWAACDKYKPVGGGKYVKLCGNCIYCDKFDPGDFILSEDATCHYPVAVH